MPQPGEEISYRDEFIETRIKSVNGKLVRETIDLKTGRQNLKQTFSKNGNLDNQTRNYTGRAQPKNTRGLIGQFIDHARNVGFQRNNRFVVLVNGPSIISDFKSPYMSAKDYLVFGKTGKRNYLKLDHKRRLALTCQDATLSGKALMTQEFNNTGNGPNTIHAYAENYSNDLSLTFLNSGDFFERMYFEGWMEKIINTGTHEVSMYEDYAMPWSIIVAVLPSNLDSPHRSGATIEDIANKTTQTKLSDIYFIRYDHVYPYRINDQSLTTGGTGDILKFQVQFRFHRWYDPVVRYVQDKRSKQIAFEGKPAQITDPYSQYLGKNVEAGEYTPVNVRRADGPNYNPIEDEISMSNDERLEELSPFDRFRKTFAKYARYADPDELKGLVINEGIGQLENALGAGTVERLAQGGQIIDAFVKTDDKSYPSVAKRLIGPLGNTLNY